MNVRKPFLFILYDVAFVITEWLGEHFSLIFIQASNKLHWSLADREPKEEVLGACQRCRLACLEVEGVLVVRVLPSCNEMMRL